MAGKKEVGRSVLDGRAKNEVDGSVSVNLWDL